MFMSSGGMIEHSGAEFFTNEGGASEACLILNPVAIMTAMLRGSDVDTLTGRAELNKESPHKIANAIFLLGRNRAFKRNPI